MRAGKEIARQRAQAIGLLDLQPGDRVVDVGSGGGSNLALLCGAVGPTGVVVGVEAEEAAVETAAALIAASDWTNIELLWASAAEATWNPAADAALFAFTGALLLQADSVLNVLRQLRPGARVAALEPTSAGRRGPSIQPGEIVPDWRLLALYLDGFAVQRFRRSALIATGKVSAARR